MPALDHLTRDAYPKSNGYDAKWLVDLDMGPHPLWLLEDLAADLDLRPGMRVLDLGSGLGATSVFLAREYGVSVVAADLWVDPTEAAAVFRKEGVDDRVLAVRVDAHALPFGRGSFDAILSIDAWEYFGTGDHYPPYLATFLKPGGQARRRDTRPHDRGARASARSPSTSTASSAPSPPRGTPPTGCAASGSSAAPSRPSRPAPSRTRARTGCCGNVRSWSLKGQATSPVQGMLEADGGAFVTFALVTGRVA